MDTRGRLLDPQGRPWTRLRASVQTLRTFSPIHWSLIDYAVFSLGVWLLVATASLYLHSPMTFVQLAVLACAATIASFLPAIVVILLFSGAYRLHLQVTGSQTLIYSRIGEHASHLAYCAGNIQIVHWTSAKYLPDTTLPQQAIPVAIAFMLGLWSLGLLLELLHWKSGGPINHPGFLSTW